MGLEEQTQFSTANLVTYPNPVGDVLNIDLSNSENRAGIISIHSLEGKVVQQQKINETGIVKLNLGQLPRGIYFVITSYSIHYTKLYDTKPTKKRF